MIRGVTGRIVALLAALTVAVIGVAPTYAQQGQPANSQARTYAFPAGEVVFPEGVATNPANSQFYVSSTANGAIYRGDVRQPNRGLSVFLPGGADGRTAATGMKVDQRGFLWVSGGATGKMWMYDTRNGNLLSEFSNGASDTFVNDVAIAGDAAYFTDSRTPFIYRIKPNENGIFTFEYWRDLRDSPISYGSGFNLNGIAATADGEYLIVVQSNTGKLFRVATDNSKEITEIKLAGGDLMTNGDGILLDGQILHVVRNSLNLIVQIRLAPDFASGQQVGSFTDSSFQYSTTIAKSGDRLLVVNSQFDKRGNPNAQPVLPFTVSSVPVPSVR